MKSIPQQLESLIRAALSAAQQAGSLPDFPLPDTLTISPPKDAQLADYASPIALALAKPARMKPLEIANVIHQALPSADLLESVTVSSPGFLNFRLSESWIRARVEDVIRQGANFFRQEIGTGQRAQVEFVSANPTGPLHIGRTRGAILGDTLASVLAECGWTVEREYYFNNAGAQMEMLGRSLQARYLQKLGKDAQLPENGYQGDYLLTFAEKLAAEVGEDWTESDWKPFKEYAEAAIFEMIKATLARVGVRHDHFFNEQFVYDDNSVWQTLERLRANGHIYDAIERDGAQEDKKRHKKASTSDQPATWFRSTTFGDSEDRVVVKSSGDPTYVLPDIAYHVNKLERGYKWIVDIFGGDHIIEAQTVARGLTALDYDASIVKVLLHQFVSFVDKDGNQVKMSTRSGAYETLDDLIDLVGVDVVRYFMLARSPNTRLDFNMDLAVEQSRENPVYYIQNAHVRCCGIFRQAAERGLPADWDADADLSQLGAAEMGFIRKILELPEQLIFAHDNLAPHQIAFWALDLARLFHPLYDEVRVLHEDVPPELAKARLRFYRAAQHTFAYVLGVMGMSAPERM